MKIKILKWFLRISAVIQILYWGVSHLFFPRWYLNSIGLYDDAKNPGHTLIFLNEIGMLTVGIGIATWLCASDPLKNVNIIIMLYIVSLGSICVSIYHIIFQNTIPGEWITVAVILIQVIILSILFPRKAQNI